MATIAEQAKWLGQTVGLRVAGFTVSMVVLDVRTRYGKTDVLLRPVSGSGQEWKETSAVQFSVA